MQYFSLAVLAKRIRAIKSLLLDSSVPKRKKILIIFGIIYLLVPFDIIPAPVLGFSIIDDAVVWLFILSHLSEELDSYWRDKKSEESEEPVIDMTDRDVYESTGETIEED